MLEKFSDISASDILVPGEIYIITGDSDRGWDPCPVEYIYTLKDQREVADAFEMEFGIVTARYYENVKYLGERKICKDCREFKFECIERDSKEKIIYFRYLHRIQTFPECLSEMKELFKGDYQII